MVGQDEPIIRPIVSEDLDYECELALVIGKPGRHIARDEAMSHVAGYSCFNDASVRDYQVSHSLPAGKNFFATGGFGPWLVTVDEIPDPGNLALRTLINGVEVQHGNTRDLIFDIPSIIAYVSGFTPLGPGDVYFDGNAGGRGIPAEAAALSQAWRCCRDRGREGRDFAQSGDCRERLAADRPGIIAIAFFDC